jgi:modulator of FtsH protease HflK
MSDEHEHHHTRQPDAPEGQDAGSQALAEAFHSSFSIIKFVMVLLVLLFLGSGIFQVGPQEKAIILRFGKPVGEGQKALLGQGLHWSFPYPIDEVVKIPITEVQQVQSTIGWYAMTSAQEAAFEATGTEPPAGASLIPGVDGYVITADRNIIHVRATLYYHVDKPIQYVFDFVSASNTIQDALNNALLYTAARFKVDDILYNDVGGFQDAVAERVGELADREHLGITINQCTVNNEEPPRQLEDIFNQVTEARQNRDQILEEAHSEENQITNSADAQASAILNESMAASSNYVQNVRADARAFSVLLPNYELDPSLFEQQKLVQVMGNVLTNARDQIFLPEPLGSGTPEFRLLLNREPPEPKPGAQTEE